MILNMCSLNALPLYFLEWLILLVTPQADNYLSIWFFKFLVPNQTSVVSLFDSNSSLVSIFNFSKSFNNVRILSIPKNLPARAHLNHCWHFLPTSTSVILRLNSSGLLLQEVFNKESWVGILLNTNLQPGFKRSKSINAWLLRLTNPLRRNLRINSSRTKALLGPSCK